jgi:large repetitive protein
MRRQRSTWLLAIGGVFFGLVGLLAWRYSDNAKVVYAACDGNRLFLGSYYLLPDDSSHPDFEQALQLLAPVSGQLQPGLGANGLPVPTSPNPPLNAPNTSIRQFDWYTPQYQIFTRLDDNPLAFSNYGAPGTRPFFGPGTNPAASAAIPANKDLFAVQWRANVVVPAGGLTLPYSIALDDAGWVFVDGQLALDYGGIHPPQTFTGNFTIPAGQHTIDIFYADRHTTEAVTTFQLSNLNSLVACGSPVFNVTKAVTPTGAVSPGDILTYTVSLTNSGNFTATNVLISDALPANTTFLSATPPQTGGPAPGGLLTWQIPGDLPPGASANVSFAVQVNAGTPPGTIISNAANVTSRESGGVAFQSNRVTNNVASLRSVGINKTANPPPGAVLQGNNITYTLTVTNNGNAPSGQINVTDNVPAGTTFVSASPNPTSAPPFNGTGAVIWTLSNLAPGQSATLTLTVRVTASPGSVINNSATAQSSSGTTTSPIVSHQVQASSDVGVNKRALFSLPVAANSLVTYTISAFNAGPSVANNVVVSDTLQAGLTLVGASTSPAPDVSSAPPLYRWVFPTLNVGESRLITIVAQVGATPPASFSNTATISSPAQDPQPGNNTATATVPGGAAPNQATFTKPNVNAPNEISPGEIFTYTLTFTNNDPNPISNIVITDTVPAAVTVLYSTPPFLNPAANTYVWNIGTLGVGQTATILIYAQLAPGAPVGTSVTNNATATFGDPAVAANTRNASTTTNVVASADLELNKTLLTGTTFSPGQNLTFRVAVRNNSTTTAATNVTVNDILPAGVNFVSATPAPVTTTPLSFNIASIAPGATAIIDIVVNVPTSFTGSSLTNSANASAQQRDLLPGNNTGSVSVPSFNISSALVLNKTAPSTVRRGEIFNYNIRVTNTTGATLNNVVITDAVPPGLLVLNAVPATASTNPLTWNFPAILPFGVVDIVLTVQVPQNFNQTTINNSATGTAGNFGGQASTNSNLNVVNVSAPRATSTPAITARAVTVAPTATAGGVATVAAPTSEATAVVTETATPEVTETATTTPVATQTTMPDVTEEAPTVAPTPTVAEEIMPTPGTLPGLPDTGTAKASNSAGSGVAWVVLILFLLGVACLATLFWLAKTGVKKKGAEVRGQGSGNTRQG